VSLHVDEDTVQALDVERRLETLAQMADGWLEGEGAKPTPAVMQVMAALLQAMERRGCSPPHLYPTVEGGLQAEWAFADAEVSVELDSQAGAADFFGVHLPTGATTDERIALSPLEEAATALSNLVSRFSPQIAQGAAE
jgi:hypothetical protein